MSDIVSPEDWKNPGVNCVCSHLYPSSFVTKLEPRLNPKFILANATIFTSYKCLNFSLLKSCLKKTSWPAFSCANSSKQSKPYHGKQKLCLGKIAWTALQTEPQTAPGVLSCHLPSWYLTAHKQQVPFCPILPPNHRLASFWYSCLFSQEVKCYWFLSRCSWVL